MDAIRRESIRALYTQMRAAGSAALIGVAYMIGSAALFNTWMVVVAWGLVMFAVQAARQLLIRGFYKEDPQRADLEIWARAFVIHQCIAGLAWGSAMFLFAHPDQPVTISLVLCGTFLIVVGALPAQAYTPTSFHVLNAAITSLVAIRLMATGEVPYILLGAICVVFGLAMRAFCIGQGRLVSEGFRIRFENDALLREVTSQKVEAEEARRHAETSNLTKSQFLAAASHDLRQPLYALSLFSMSLSELKLDADGRKVVASIQDSIATMESLFTGLLDVSRLEAGVVQARFAPVAVDALFDRLSQYFRPIAIERGLDLRFRSDGEWVMSDATLIEQVLSNLLSNALRCTESGAVLMAARKRGQDIRFEVWDTGIGIGETDRQRIFNEFVQLNNPERDRRKGLGLGLSIAQRSAALINGAITLASKPGRGSRFTITQPATSCPVVDQSPVQIAPPPARTTSVRAGHAPVLIVDDNQDVRAALSDLLTRWNVRFDMFASPAEALRCIDGGSRYGLVLADYRLPGATTGLDLIAAITRSHPAPKPVCALITGDFDPQLMADVHAIGIQLFHKPISAQDLRALINLPNKL